GPPAVEKTFFGQDNAIVEGERIDNGGPHAARSGRPDDDHAVAAEQREIGGKVRPEETRGLLLFDHDVPRARRDHRDDLVAVDIVAGVAAGLVAPRALPAPAAGIPVVRAPL